MVEQPGQSCAELVACIEVAKGTDEEILRFQEEFQRKIWIRGKECTDKRFFFEISEQGMKFFDFSCVPHPEATDDMVPLEWIAKLSNENALLESDLFEVAFHHDGRVSVISPCPSGLLTFDHSTRTKRECTLSM